MIQYIQSKIAQWQKTGREPEYESLSLADYNLEFDYATRLCRSLK